MMRNDCDGFSITMSGIELGIRRMPEERRIDIRIKTKFRKPIDTFAPLVGDLFRVLLTIAAHIAWLDLPLCVHVGGCPVLAREDFEQTGSNTFLDLLESHECVLDIGANVGFLFLPGFQPWETCHLLRTVATKSRLSL